MNILVEGPRWMGQWSEIVVDSFMNLGHPALLHYHNDKTMAFRLDRLIRGRDLAAFSNERLLAAARGRRIDLLFSIQDKIDAATVRALRDANPGLKVVYGSATSCSTGHAAGSRRSTSMSTRFCCLTTATG